MGNEEKGTAPRDELDRMRDELDRLRAQLLRSEKMAAIGAMVAGIAHEINTPIGAVVSVQDTLVRGLNKLKAALDDHCPEHAKHRGLRTALNALDDASKVIESASSRVSVIVGRLRSFARGDEAERQPVDVHEAIEDTLVLLHNQIKTRIEVKRVFGEIPLVSGFGGQIKQVLLNVIVNAAQSIEQRGTIQISTSVVPSSNGDVVEVAISDDGCGITPNNLAKVFAPGFTTKEGGTGLGLAICKDIIDAHDGTMVVDSELGKGTTFTITLPVTAR